LSIQTARARLPWSRPRRAAARRIGARTRPISGGRAAPPTFTAAGCSSTAIPSGGRTTTARAPGSMPICSMGSRAAGTRTSSGDWAMPRCNRERDGQRSCQHQDVAGGGSKCATRSRPGLSRHPERRWLAANHR
jgi:hypothetical protein